MKASGLSTRKIAASLSVGQATVVEYLKRADRAGLSWPLPEGEQTHTHDRTGRRQHQRPRCREKESAREGVSSGRSSSMLKGYVKGARNVKGFLPWNQHLP